MFQQGSIRFFLLCFSVKMVKRAASEGPHNSGTDSFHRKKKTSQPVQSTGIPDGDTLVERGPILELTLDTIRPLCPGCGSDQIEAHEASGSMVCTDCGVIVEEEMGLPKISLSPSLDEFLCVGFQRGSQLTSSDFLKDYLHSSCAVYVSCGDADDINRKYRVSKLVKAMHNLSPTKILRDTSSDNIFVWLLEQGQRQGDSSTSKNRSTFDKCRNYGSPRIRSIEVDNVDTAIALYNAGHATYCRAPPEVEQNLVASFLKSTGLGCGQYDPTGVENPLCLGRGEVETFLSKEGHTTSWHFDFQHNFTIQLSGTKRWTLQQGTILFPLRGCTPHYSETSATVESQLKSHYMFDKRFVFAQPAVPTNAKGEAKEVVLRPGDCLFFPAGMWHKVETLSDSVSINVSLMATNYAQAVSQAVYHFLYSDPRFREPIINNAETNAVDRLRQLMIDLPQLVSKLSKNDGTGAEDILPPILRYPPSFRAILDDSDNDDDVVDDDDENIDDDHSDEENGDQNVNLDDRPVAMYADDHGGRNSQEVEEEDEEEIVDPSEFVSYPEEWNFELEIGSTVDIFKNPLSALHKLEEITNYFNKDAKHTRRAREAFVLNVNYGGNEMQNSAIRVAFLDNLESFVDLLWHKDRASSPLEPSAPLHTCTVTINNHYLLSFLVFHGYIQVKKV